MPHVLVVLRCRSEREKERVSPAPGSVLLLRLRLAMLDRLAPASVPCERRGRGWRGDQVARGGGGLTAQGDEAAAIALDVLLDEEHGGISVKLAARSGEGAVRSESSKLATSSLERRLGSITRTG